MVLPSAAATSSSPAAISRSRLRLAIFGQVGPKVGSVDPGFGTALLARVVGEKKAREIWMLCRRYTPNRRCRWDSSMRLFRRKSSTKKSSFGARRSRRLSPTAIAIAKRSFNQDSESIRGISAMGMQALSLFYQTEESREGVNAFLEKRPPKFREGS